MILEISEKDLRLISACLGYTGNHEKEIYKRIKTMLEDKDRLDGR